MLFVPAARPTGTRVQAANGAGAGESRLRWQPAAFMVKREKKQQAHRVQPAARKKQLARRVCHAEAARIIWVNNRAWWINTRVWWINTR